MFKNMDTSEDEEQTLVDPGRWHVKSMPMFEVVSISVKPNNIPTEFGDRPWQIHGVIEATEQGVQYDLYCKPPNDPEIITRNHSNGISLTLTDEALYDFIFPERLKVDLKDGVQDLVKKTFLLDYRDYHDYDKIKSEIIEGAHASVCVEYITYRAAVLAIVELILEYKEDGDNIGKASVSGAVLAKRDYISTELVRFPNESAEVKLGTPIVLSRSVVAVPAYSSLQIVTELKVDGCWVVSDIVEFPAEDSAPDAKDVEGPNGLLYQVRVKWSHTYQEWDETESINEASSENREASGEHREASKMGQGKKRRALLDHQQASSSRCVYNIQIPVRHTPERLMEVFSIFIGVNKDGLSTASICGKIEVRDSHDTFKIFEKEESCLENLGDDRILTLQGPLSHCFAGFLTMEVDLKDNMGNELCKGFLVWHDGHLEDLWYERRICSIIPGKGGYAAVHYTIFKNAVQARVKAFFSSSSSIGHTNVSGRIVTAYNDLDYFTSYERDYYQSVLFSRPHDSPCQLFQCRELALDDILNDEKGIPIPLSKSVVCVPIHSSLIINVNLSAESRSVETLFGTVEFEVGRKTCWRIKSQTYQVHFFVEWDGVFLCPEYF